MSNTDLAPLFFRRNLWRCTGGGDISKHFVLGDFCSKTFTGCDGGATSAVVSTLRLLIYYTMYCMYL